jgi:hypothetical protein
MDPQRDPELAAISARAEFVAELRTNAADPSAVRQVIRARVAVFRDLCLRFPGLSTAAHAAEAGGMVPEPIAWWRRGRGAQRIEQACAAIEQDLEERARILRAGRAEGILLAGQPIDGAVLERRVEDVLRADPFRVRDPSHGMTIAKLIAEAQAPMSRRSVAELCTWPLPDGGRSRPPKPSNGSFRKALQKLIYSQVVAVADDSQGLVRGPVLERIVDDLRRLSSS